MNGERVCSLSYLGTASDPGPVVIRYMPGRGASAELLMVPPRRMLPGEEAALMVRVDGWWTRRYATRDIRLEGRILAFHLDFVHTVDLSLAVKHGGAPVFQLDVGQQPVTATEGREAGERMQDCIRRSLTESRKDG